MPSSQMTRSRAFPALSKMRDEGIIRAWGIGVNTPQPILKAINDADPDVCLCARQYSPSLAAELRDPQFVRRLIPGGAVAVCRMRRRAQAARAKSAASLRMNTTARRA